MLKERTLKKIEKRFNKFVKKDGKIDNAYLLIHNDKRNVHIKLVEGTKGSEQAHPDQPYYIANIQKTFIATIIAMLEQQKKLSYEDTVVTYLDEALLEGIHIYKGFGYSKVIQIKHLLNHTSGINDFVEDEPKKAEPFIEKLLKDRNESFTKEDVILWSKENLKAKFTPGDGFHYSDTGYLLLTLIIEKVTGRPYVEVLTEYILKRLNMKHTYMLHHSEPAEKNDYPIAPCYVRNVDMTQENHLLFDDIIGRIFSTSEDLLIFMKALVNYELLERDNLNKLTDWAKFPIGVDYGYGIVKTQQVAGFIPDKYEAWGNVSLTGAFMFYHQQLETYFIGSLNTERYQQKSILLMNEMIDILYKEMKERKDS